MIPTYIFTLKNRITKKLLIISLKLNTIITNAHYVDQKMKNTHGSKYAFFYYYYH